MNPGPRRRIEANADVSHYLGQIRQAYHLHANQQLAPGSIPELWTTLHRNHYSHGWRIHVSLSNQPGWEPPTTSVSQDPRDFVPFLRQQLTTDELAFALFVLFRAQRTSMRNDAGAEVKRRYNALRGNVGNFSEDDVLFELGPDVLRSTPALRTLNSLLNPRNTGALRLEPAVVFRAVRAEMLERHQDPTDPPSVIPADVTRAALRLRPRASLPSPTPGPAQAAAQEEAQQEAGSRAPSVPSDDGSLSLKTGRKRKAFGSHPSSPAPQRRRLDQELEDQDEDEDEDDESVPGPESQRQHGQGEDGKEELDLGQRSYSPSMPPFSPLADTPRTPPPIQAANSDAASSPADFQTPNQEPLDMPPGVRPALREELERWQEIVRLAQAMPAPQGSILWQDTVRTAVQSLTTVGHWVEEMLDQEALRDESPH